MTHKTNRQIFALPILLGVSTCAGLGAGLLLALPLVVTGRYWVRAPITQSRAAEAPRVASIAH